MSITEFVMVPRELAGRIAASIGYEERDELREIMAKPAMHQGEPVAWPARLDTAQMDGYQSPYDRGWNACLDKIAKLGPLYSRSVQGEPVEADGATFMGEPNFQHSIEWYREGISKHWKKICDQRLAIEAMQKQLAKSQAMLRIYESFPGYLIDNCEGDTIYEESLQHWLADHIKALPASAEPSAPVEIDERAAITLEQVLQAYEYAEHHPHRYLRGTTNWCAAVAHSLNKQARAVLERKP